MEKECGGERGVALIRDRSERGKLDYSGRGRIVNIGQGKIVGEGG